MRVIPHDISDRVARTMQTAANNANPSADIWISRPNTALVSDAFLERQKIFDTPVTDASIAVCHPRFKADNTMIFIGYVSDGKARVISALTKSKMDEHTWLNHDFEEDADSVSIAFDGVMKMGVDDKIEFVTETSPWIFWTSEGVLYAQKLDSDVEPEVLAVANCTDVSAICASDSATSSFNFGLIVFFVLAGTLYYRQLIGGVWMDGVPVSYAPINIVEIAAFRTWDHRVGVQMKTEDGKIHEIYTQYMGIGKRNTEHIGLDVRATGRYTAIQYHDTSTTEHVEVGNVTASGGMLWGISSIPLEVRNVDNGEGNYGYFVEVTFDRFVTNVENQNGAFSLVDTVSGISYICMDTNISEDGLVMTLEFMNFNLSEGNDLVLSYTPGTIQCIVAKLDAFECRFTPTNLVRPDVPIPEPISAVSLDSTGVRIALTFSQKLLTFNIADNVYSMGITMKRYDFVPGGSLIEETRTVTKLEIGDSEDTLILTLADGVTNSIRNAIGEVHILYEGGTLYGEGGPVADFDFAFEPSGLVSKNNPHITDHVEVGDITATGTLKRITYTDSRMVERVEIGNVTAVGTLIHIDDL